MGRTESKQTAFLLEPKLMSEGKPVVSLLHIVKANRIPDFRKQELQRAVIEKDLLQHPRVMLDLLHDCSPEAVGNVCKRLKFVKQEARFDNDDYQQRELAKYWYKIFVGLKPFFPSMKWYYRREQVDKKAMLTAPCSFSVLKPSLSFEVIKTDTGLQLKAHVLIGNDRYCLSKLTRSHFFLVEKNEIFILDFSDYEALEKIAKLPVSRFSHDPAGFAKNVLAKIEKRFPVKRNNHIPVVEIATHPVCRVLLTELNQKFLMITPQWIYEGIVVDLAMNSDTEISRNGAIYSISRDDKAEKEFIQILTSLHKNFATQRNGYFYLSFAEAMKKQWFFHTYRKLLDLNIEIAGMDMLVHFRYSPHIPETVLEIHEGAEDLITVKMDVSFGGETVPLPQLQKILLAGQKAVVLKDGSLGILGQNWIREYAPLVLHGKIEKKEIKVLRWIAIPGQRDNHTLTETIKEDWWKKWDQWQSGDGQVYSVPSALLAKLRPYQHKGYEWLLLLQETGAGACLADDMGLGKSVQTIAAIARHVARNPGQKSIIICPASLIYTWKDEFEKFAPSIKAIVYHGHNRQQDSLTSEGTDVIITTYSTLRNDVDMISTGTFGIAVLDESHNIKNPVARISQAAMRINARFRIALSGTPVINNTFDLYSQLQFVVPGLFGSREFFRSHYANPIDNMQDEEKIAALQKLTAPFILRRTKEQVARELPEKTESVLWCKMGAQQRSVYEEILESTRNSIFLGIRNNGLAKSKFSILQGMTKLRQVCSSPELVQLDGIPFCGESVKLISLMDELENLLGKHKVIVFTQFTKMLHLIGAECRKQGMKFYHFDGQTPPLQRTEMVQSFQKGEGADLFLISLKAGNTGLTLTAADYVFLFDPWWNSAVENQAIDRTHRIGQTKNVFAYKMICKDTIEEKILTLQQRKTKLSEDLITADDNFVKSLSEKDVEFLFS